jgi:hypothetical protein
MCKLWQNLPGILHVLPLRNTGSRARSAITGLLYTANMQARVSSWLTQNMVLSLHLGLMLLLLHTLCFLLC